MNNTVFVDRPPLNYVIAVANMFLQIFKSLASWLKVGRLSTTLWQTRSKSSQLRNMTSVILSLMRNLVIWSTFYVPTWNRADRKRFFKERIILNRVRLRGGMSDRDGGLSAVKGGMRDRQMEGPAAVRGVCNRILLAFISHFTLTGSLLDSGLFYGTKLIECQQIRSGHHTTDHWPTISTQPGCGVAWLMAIKCLVVSRCWLVNNNATLSRVNTIFLLF